MMDCPICSASRTELERAAEELTGSATRAYGPPPRPGSRPCGRPIGCASVEVAHGDAVIRFGKHKGKTLLDIFKEDKSYLQWISNQDWYRDKDIALYILDNM